MRSIVLFLSIVLYGCDSDKDAANPTDTADTDTDTDSDTDTDTDTDSDTDTDVSDLVVDCGVELTPPAEGLCEVRPGTDGSTVLQGTVLGPEQAYVGGTVVIDATGTITCAGCNCVIPLDGTHITCADGVISPGFIDPHEHLTFAETGPLDVGDARFDHRHDWRRGGLTTPNNVHGNDSVLWAELREVLGGTTTIAGSGGVAGFLRNADRSGLDEGAGLAVVDYDTFPLGDSDGTFRSDCNWTYGVDAYNVSTESAYVTHVAEGIDAYAAEEFRCLSDAVAGGEDVTEPNVAHFHSIGLHTLDYDQMARDGTVLVWSPRSNLQLYGETARVTSFAAVGGQIALGTDWAFTGSIHPGRELACADAFNRDYLDGAFSDRELWWMATRNAAVALRADDKLGTLEADHLADIAVFAGASTAANPWRAVIDAESTEVALVLRGGVPLYGESAVVAALGRTCEAVDVCGSDRVVCAEQESGQTYATLQAAVTGNYAAFFCGDPTDEPVCSPMHGTDWTGERTADDSDGDGVADAADLCPTVFDPIRPLDAGEQSDLDGDGLGDACDPDPVPVDIDGDGVDNDSDNCPYVENAGQEDGDADNHGDVCDACPEVANPGTVCPP